MNEYQANQLSFHLMAGAKHIRETDAKKVTWREWFFADLHGEVSQAYGHNLSELEGYDSSDRKT